MVSISKRAGLGIVHMGYCKIRLRASNFSHIKKGEQLFMQTKKLFTTLLLSIVTGTVFAAHHEEIPATNIWLAQNIEFKDGQQLNFRQGLAEFMSSEMGKAMPGQVFYNWIVADGDAPATHGLVFLFPSMSAWTGWNIEFWTAAAKGNNPAAKWAMTYGASVESASTATAKIMRAWGPLTTSGPSEWIPFYTDNLASFTEEFAKFMETPGGKSFKGSVLIHQCIACGDSSYNAGFSVNHESAESFDKWYSSGVNSPDFTSWVSKANESAEFPGASLMATLDSYPAQ